MKHCTHSGFSELFRSQTSLDCISKKNEEILKETRTAENLNIEQYVQLTQQPCLRERRRGVPVVIKEDLKIMMKIDPDLPPKRARRNLLTQQKEKFENGEKTYDATTIPELNKVNINMLTAYLLIGLIGLLICRLLHGCVDTRNLYVTTG